MAVSVRAIAQKTGLSVATISRALRGSPLVTAATRTRVEKAARALGYAYSPLVGAVMSNLRRSRGATYIGNLAIVQVRPETDPVVPFQEEIAAGARDRARALGLGLDVQRFVVGRTRGPALHRILRSRGVAGLIFTDFRAPARADLADFDWRPFAAVEIEYPLTSPRLHVVGTNHHATLQMALRRLTERGYRRIGLFIERARDQRLAFRWTGGFAAFQHGIAPSERVPGLELPAIDRRAFLAWFRRHRPDVLVGHNTGAIEWLRAEGVQVPRDAGFFCLNLMDAGVPCAGLDLEPRTVGAAAVEAVFGQMLQFESGLPSRPKTILVEGSWVEGPTLASAPPPLTIPS